MTYTLSEPKFIVKEYGGEGTGMRSAYFWRIRSASALRFSKGCSSLNLDRMVAVCVRDDTIERVNVYDKDKPIISIRGCRR